MRAILCVGGTDPTGGAGITLDARVCAALGYHPLTVATCIIVQDADRVRRVVPLNVAHILAQLAAAVDTTRPVAVKLSVLPTEEAIEALSEFIEQRGLTNIVGDPVFLARNGTPLTPGPPQSEAWQKKIAPRCVVVALNVKEAELLTGERVRTVKEAEQAAKKLSRELGTAVVVKGGHLPRDEAVDVLAEGGKAKRFPGEKLGVKAHGAGCAFSAALACGLAEGLPLQEAVARAKEFVFQALRRAKVPEGATHALLIP